jgi:hypothetical protein
MAGAGAIDAFVGIVTSAAIAALETVSAVTKQQIRLICVSEEASSHPVAA